MSCAVVVGVAGLRGAAPQSARFGRAGRGEPIARHCLSAFFIPRPETYCSTAIAQCFRLCALFLGCVGLNEAATAAGAAR